MSMKKKYQVFISSTYTDLIEERNAVAEMLLKCDCIPVGMEQFPSSNMSQMEYIRMMLDNCDYYVLILAGKYGSCDESGIGYTEQEYMYALEKKLPVLSFVYKDIGNLQSSKCEENDEGREKLKKFREKVMKNKLVSFFNNVGELTANVSIAINQAIRDTPAVGWIRGDSLQTSVETRISVNEEVSVSIQDKSSGVVAFDYSNDNGECVIGDGEYLFHTKWSKASDVTIHAYTDGIDIASLCLIKNPGDIKNLDTFSGNFSSRVRTPYIGDAILWKNIKGHYAITKILAVSDDTRGAERDWLELEYIIYPN